MKKWGVIALAAVLIPAMVLMSACGSSVPRDGKYVLTAQSIRASILGGMTNAQLRIETIEELREDGHTIADNISDTALLAIIKEMMEDEESDMFEGMELELNWAQINNWNQYVNALLEAFAEFFAEIMYIEVEGNEMAIRFPFEGISLDYEFEMNGRNVVLLDEKGEEVEDKPFTMTYRNGRFTVVFEAEANERADAPAPEAVTLIFERV